MKTKATPRKRVWLRVNGHTNTLRQHIVRAGYRIGYESTIAKKHKCKASEIPLDVLAEYLVGKVEVVDSPANWQDIMYGSDKQKRGKTQSVKEFMTMKLSRSPVHASYY